MTNIVSRISVFSDNQFTHKMVNVLEYFLAAFLILDSNSVYFRAFGGSEHKILLIALFLNFLIISLLAFMWIYSHGEIKPLVKLFIWFTAIYLVFCVLNNLNYPLMKAKSSFFIMYVIPLISAVYFKYCLSQYKMNSLLMKIEKIMIVIAALSLIMWLIGPIFNLVSPTGTKVIIWDNKLHIPSYFNIFFNAQGYTTFLGMNIVRNTGIFVEAPMFSFALTVALLTNLFLEKRFGLRTIILVVTIVSSTSTTGVIIALSALAIKVILNNRVLKLLSRWKYYVIPAVGVLIVIVIAFLVNKKMHENGNSYSIRLNDFYAGYRAWISHPLIGTGMGNYKAIEKFMYPFRLLPHGNNGFSTGMMRVLAGGGIFLLSFYLMPLLILTKRFLIHNKELVIFGAYIFVIFIVTILDQNYLYLSIISWMWINALFRRNEWAKNNNETGLS